MKRIATNTTLLPADIRAALSTKEKLAAMYEAYLVWATVEYGLTLVEAIAKLPSVIDVTERNRAVLATMRPSAMKTALLPLMDGPVEACIISPREPDWGSGGYAGHRAVYERFERKIGELQCDHLCEVRNCVNPSHLVAAKKVENMARAKAYGAMKKTHCGRGHELIGDKVYQHANGEQYCKTCQADRQRSRRAAEASTTVQKVTNSEKTICVNGHELTDETTHIQCATVDGKRVFRKRRCKVCWAEQGVRRRKAGAAKPVSPSRDSTHPKGRKDRTTRPGK